MVQTVSYQERGEKEYNVHGISSKMGILIFFWELGLVEENLSVTAGWKGSINMENLRSFKIDGLQLFTYARFSTEVPHSWKRKDLRSQRMIVGDLPFPLIFFFF